MFIKPGHGDKEISKMNKDTEHPKSRNDVEYFEGTGKTHTNKLMLVAFHQPGI